MPRARKARVPTPAQLRRITKRGVAWIIPEDEFEQRLRSGTRLRLKMGFDPTVPVITLGWAVGLRKLRQLQDLGHTVVIIIGDWTARIGDPSEQSRTRRMIPTRQVRSNANKILQQFYKILDRRLTEVRWQREWFDDFPLTKLATLASNVTVSKMLSRADFWKRFEAKRPIHLQEFIYPLLQAYDSVEVKADVEFGGTDQEFNILLGRELQPKYNQPAQCAFFMRLLVGLDGKKKMSQSLDNYVAIDEPADQMYGKIMRLPDSVMDEYFELLTDVSDRELTAIRNSLTDRTQNPIDLKMRLAREIVTQFHSKELAFEVGEEFHLTYRTRTPKTVAADLIPLPRTIEEVPVRFRGRRVKTESLPTLLNRSGLVSSVSEARRLINEGAVRHVGTVVGHQDIWSRQTPKALRSAKIQVGEGMIIRVGKHRFLRIVDADK